MRGNNKEVGPGFVSDQVRHRNTLQLQNVAELQKCRPRSKNLALGSADLWLVIGGNQ